MKITVEDTPAEQDITVAFTGDRDRDNLWITIDPGPGRPHYSINIVRTDEGIVVDGYFLGHEDVPPTGTFWTFDGDLDDILAEKQRLSEEHSARTSGGATVAVPEGADHD